MDKWDDAKLAEVVNQKQGALNNNIPTDIVCKFFIEAIRNKKYGWFWECPNGTTCKYRHALPPGFSLKELTKDKGEEEEKEAIELVLERERANLKLAGGGTPVTKERFMKWKADKAAARAKAEAEAATERAKEIKAGRAHRSGRELFVFNPDLFIDDDDAADNQTYSTREVEVEVEADGNEERNDNETSQSVANQTEAGKQIGEPVPSNEHDQRQSTESRDALRLSRLEAATQDLAALGVEDASLFDGDGDFSEEDLPG